MQSAAVAMSGIASSPTRRKCQPSDEDGGFDRLLGAMHQRWDAMAVRSKQPLFLVEPAVCESLHEVWQRALPERYRPHYACNCCRHFIERFGALAVVDTDGRLKSAVWPEPGDVPETFRAAMEALRRAVCRGTIDSAFLTSEKWLGTAQTGPWSHLALPVPPARIHRDVTKSAAQAVAVVREERGMLLRGIEEFPADLVTQAHGLLTSGALYRSEKCQGVAKWLLDLHLGPVALKDARRREALLWVAAATAPAGFCHVRSGMIGTLLEDLQAGLDLNAVKARFAEKMNPLQYLRPSAAPSDGNLAQAEKVVAALASAGALARRFARISDVTVRLWEMAPLKEEAPPKGVFGHLRNGKGAPKAAADIGAATRTWKKFAAEVLPDAVRIEFLVPSCMTSYIALVTAQDPLAPPILQWDREEQRNPVSWYVYPSRSQPHTWGLQAGTAVEVLLVCGLPPQWHGGHPHQGEGAVLVLRGCRDTAYRSGSGFFPECLRSEYHPVRASMEAYARKAVIAGHDELDLASGLDLRKGQNYQDVRLRVTSKLGTVGTYTIDRWD